MGNNATRKLRTWMAHGTNKDYENFHKKRNWNKRKLLKKKTQQKKHFVTCKPFRKNTFSDHMQRNICEHIKPRICQT